MSSDLHTYKDITYSLKQSQRKTMSIYIERDGSVTVLAPQQLSLGDIQAQIEKKRYKIHKDLAEWESLNAARKQRQYVNGESFLYLGTPYRLELVEKQQRSLVLEDGYFKLSKRKLHKADEVFKEFYRSHGLPVVEQRVNIYKEKLGTSPTRVRVLELKNHWGSASKQGVLNFHWKCIMAPIQVLDYIIVHELCHLKQPTHNEAFWNLVDKLMPNYAEQKGWLREHGAGMDL